MIRIYLLGHGWHTGLALPIPAVADDLLPERLHFPEAEFLEVGWGDEGFYCAEKVTVGLTMKALFWPTPSVLHLVGVTGSVEGYFPRSSIIQIEVPEDGFGRMCRFIHETFDRSPDNRSSHVARGIYGDGQFFRAGPSYFFPRTCNAWSARALSTAGIRIRTWTAQTARNLLRQGRRLGKVLRWTSTRELKRAALAGEQPGPAPDRAAD